MEFLDPLKDWLDDINIVFSESPNSLRWANVMKEVTKDLEDFVENGGWNFLHDASGSENEPDSASEVEKDSDVDESDLEDSVSSSSDSSEEEASSEEDSE